ncbi:hypothetical protein CBR_g28569 [Chara braunii]|uniref:W2 domain-containing protein n=1 Tax=Chara braunii TaxID=69332 RepID=A0A388JWE1_CHABU|nr:hypothetical protein CBR_g28569 [Chara braunii]|eukprot:GBG62093.1 hypothetical protein CBR_g28569 [Chara braunii]
MALQNIGAANSDDAFYRYKMPRLITKIEGRGNGIKTNLVNMVEVAKALARPPSYTTKYFGCELGAQSKFDDKTGTSIVNGAHDTGKLAGLLEGFIKRYVQCYGCGNPETEIVITKLQTIQMKCAACGHLSDVDMRDKLTTFILKNPPETKKSAGGKKEKQLRRAEKERLAHGEAVDDEAKKASKKLVASKSRSKKEKKDDDEKRSSSGDDRPDSVGVPAVDDVEEVEWQTDTSAEAARQRIMEQLTAATSEMVVVVDTLNGDAEPKSASPKKAKDDSAAPKLTRAKSSKKASSVKEDAKSHSTTTTEVRSPSLPHVEEKLVEEVKALSLHDKMVQEVKAQLKTNSPVEKILLYLKGKKVSDKEAMSILFQALFDGLGKGLSKEVKAKKFLLSRAVNGESSQRYLLDSIEVHCGVTVPDAAKEVPLVLKVLYDEDVLEEDEILAWYDEGTKNANDVVSKSVAALVRKHATPLIEWLRSAEPESDEE